MTYVPEIHWGDGSDGSVTISINTDLAGVTKQYNNLTINVGVKLYDSTGILNIKVKNLLTLNGDIDQSGQGGAGGAGATRSTYSGSGVYHNNATHGSPGLGINGLQAAYAAYTTGCGGRGGTLTNYTHGGSITVDTDELYTLMSQFNIISQTLPTLTNGYGCGGSGGGGGGGGGGSGGLIVLYSKSISGITVSADPGTGGTGGYSLSSYGLQGKTGLSGTVIQQLWI